MVLATKLEEMQTISLNKVNVYDRTYCISYPLEDDLLLASIRQFGILTPLCLLPGQPPTVITGFKRIEAARKIGIEEIPCTFIEASERRALLTSINDNVKRPLNTVEKACCVQKMSILDFSTDEIYEVMKLVGLPARKKVISAALAVAALEGPVRDFIVKWRLPINVVDQLLAFDPEERTCVIRITDPLNLTVSHLRELLQLMALLKVKKGCVDFHDFELSEDMYELKRRLRKAVQPLLFSFEEKLRKIKASSALPPTIQIHVDPVFEKEQIDIRIQARNPFEVEDALAKLSRLLKEGLFRSIFELTHGLPGRN